MPAGGGDSHADLGHRIFRRQQFGLEEKCFEQLFAYVSDVARMLNVLGLLVGPQHTVLVLHELPLQSVEFLLVRT